MPIAFDYDTGQPVGTEYINVFDVINANNDSFEHTFLDDHKHYNMANNTYEKEVRCLVYLDYPITTMNVIQYDISYCQFENWMQNLKLINFVSKKNG